MRIEKLIVLLIDSPGFTKEVENYDPKCLFEKMQEYYNYSEKIILNYNGQIIKFIGDAILVTFNSKDINKNDFKRDLLTIKNKLEDWFCKHFYNVELSFNIHIGDAAIGEIKTKNHEFIDVFGNTINDTCKMRGEGLNISKELEYFLEN